MANQWKTVQAFANNKKGAVIVIDVDKIAYVTTVLKERDYSNTTKPEPSIMIVFGGGASIEISGTLEEFYNNVLMPQPIRS